MNNMFQLSKKEKKNIFSSIYYKLLIKIVKKKITKFKLGNHQGLHQKNHQLYSYNHYFLVKIIHYF